MDTMLILGDGALGRAVESRRTAPGRGDGSRAATTASTSSAGRVRAHDPAELAGADLVVEASRGDAVAANMAAALEAGCRRFVIATTGWADGPRRPSRRCCATTAPRPSRPPTSASGSRCSAGSSRRPSSCSGRSRTFDPYLVEWHRRSKRDRPSGHRHRPRRGGSSPATRAWTTADDLEVVSVRAGASPGMHLVGFDAAGETVELRLTARDRSAYAAGILAAADWLEPRAARTRHPRLRPHRRRAHRSPTPIAA